MSVSASPTLNEKPNNPPSRVMTTDEERGYARLIERQAEREHLRSIGSVYSLDPTVHDAVQEPPHPQHPQHPPHVHHNYGAAAYGFATDRAQVFWDRLKGKGRRRIGWGESLYNIALASCEFCPSLVVPLSRVRCKRVVLTTGWWTARAEHPLHRDSPCMGVPLGPLEQRSHVCS